MRAVAPNRLRQIITTDNDVTTVGFQVKHIIIDIPPIAVGHMSQLQDLVGIA